MESESNKEAEEAKRRKKGGRRGEAEGEGEEEECNQTAILTIAPLKIKGRVCGVSLP